MQGSGYGTDDNYYSLEWVKEDPPYPTWYSQGEPRAKRQVPSPCPACPGTLNVGDVAIRGDDQGPDHPYLDCGDQVYIHNPHPPFGAPEDWGHGIRTVRDTGPEVAKKQLDHYLGTEGCGMGDCPSPGDNLVTLKLLRIE